ncbi:MAG: transposase [Chlorobia bacterium]|nr:transposase [Fimbriimonadaceae bacterium]
MQRSNYKHWRNSQELGATLFMTATCLDFAHLFGRREIRELMAKHLIESHLTYNARLHAFVVMTHHFHIISSAPETRTCSWLMQKIKGEATKLLNGQLLETESAQTQMQVGLNDRQLWKRSFRGIPVQDERMMSDSIGYIHLNPVRAGYCENPEQYRWSSARLFQCGFYQVDYGFDLNKCLAEFS